MPASGGWDEEYVVEKHNTVFWRCTEYECNRNKGKSSFEMTAFSSDVGRFGRFVATMSGVVWLRVGVVLRLVEDLRSRPDESFGEDLKCFASFGLKEMNGGEHDQREERGDQRVNASEILESLLLARRLGKGNVSRATHRVAPRVQRP